jgi:hypothetical protein
MTLLRIEKTQWNGFCGLLSAELPGKRAEIEVASEETGVQIQVRSLPITGVTYDSRSGAFELVVDGLDHLILHPIEVYAEFGLTGIESFAIVEPGAWQIVVLRAPLMLPHFAD